MAAKPQEPVQETLNRHVQPCKKGVRLIRKMLNWQMGLGVILFLLMALLPRFQAGGNYLQTLSFWTLLYISMSASWNILGGFAGQTSFGHSAFFGLGAYVTAILWLRGVPPLLTMPIAGLVATVYSVLIGYPTLRLRGPYFAIATIGVGEATRILMLNIDDLLKGSPLSFLLSKAGVFTGGASGLPLPTPPNIRAYALSFYYGILVLTVVVLFVTVWVRSSKFGLGLFSINMDPDAAETLGVNTARYKILALMLSAFLVGICGSVYAQYIFYIDPQTVFGFSTSISLVLMPTIGGIGTIWGPVLGAIVYTVIQDRLSTARLMFAGQTIDLVRFNLLLYGGLLVLIILFEPKGIVGLIERIARAIRGLVERLNRVIRNRTRSGGDTAAPAAGRVTL